MKALKVLGRGLLELLALAIFLAVAGFLVLALIPTAEAAGTTATVRWTLPTLRLDGSALPSSAIQKATVIWRRPGAPAIVGTLDVTGAATSATVPNLVCGDFVFTVTVTTITPPAPDGTSAESIPAPLYATGINCSCPMPATGVTAS